MHIFIYIYWTFIIITRVIPFFYNSNLGVMTSCPRGSISSHWSLQQNSCAFILLCNLSEWITNETFCPECGDISIKAPNIPLPSQQNKEITAHLAFSARVAVFFFISVQSQLQCLFMRERMVKKDKLTSGLIWAFIIDNLFSIPCSLTSGVPVFILRVKTGE